MKKLGLVVILTLFGSMPVAQAADKILIVLTNEANIPETGSPSGIHFNELTHPYTAFIHAGYEVEFASPLGGSAPVDEATLQLEDPINARFWENEQLRQGLEETAASASVDVNDYVAIYLAGGVSTMWDFPYSRPLQQLIASFWESGKIVGAVCHGPAALVDVKLSDGSYLVAGKKVSAFTDEEETARDRQEIVPFLLETTLRERGAVFTEAAPFKYHVATDGNLITGQNPASAFGVAHEIIERLMIERSAK